MLATASAMSVAREDRSGRYMAVPLNDHKWNSPRAFGGL
jgi:hypothetical protein